MTQESLLQSPAGHLWESIGVRHHHGINLPLFSLHSETSCGIGEFPDLLPFISWCKEIGLDVIQLLPLNDTGLDASPYGAISAFALNPIHLGLAQLPNMSLSNLKELQFLNEEQFVDYSKVRAGKERIMRQYFQTFGDSISNSQEYAQFILVHQNWLYDYALFKAIKVIHNWYSWTVWESEIQNPSEEMYQALLKKYQSEINFHIFLQFLCFEQFHAVKLAASNQGVLLKGDIPILISKESADVWRHRSLFELELCAGAPPDVFSSDGQNWDFPIYNWAEAEKENFSWWKSRLQVASLLYHLFRIDHVVGFFRIWAVPPGHLGTMGKFIPADSSKWVPQGEKIMRMMLESSPMLPIGEDLGTVHLEIRRCLHELGICGTKVMRWERNWNIDRSFIKYEDYPIDSMTTVSTHDSDTLKLWWRNNPGEAKEFVYFKKWQYSEELSNEHVIEILRDSHHTASLFHINLLQEYLSVFPEMTWGKLDDERINVPGIVSDRNWSYRFRPSVEKIVSNESLRQLLQSIIQSA